MITSRLSRAQWGAAPIGRKPTRVSSMRGIGVHWVGPGVWGAAGIGDHSKCAGKIRGIQRAHMAGEYYDIAYSEGVCPHGQRFELRGHHIQVGANGSSFANANWYAILALVGVGDKITPELLSGIGLAVADYRRNADAGSDITAHRVLLKQYAGRSTSCCGDALYAHVVKGTFNTTTAPTTQEFVMATKEQLIEVLTSDEVTSILARKILTGSAVCKNPANPTGDRVSLSAVVELAATQAIVAASAEGNTLLTKEEAKAAFDEALAGLTVTGTLRKAGE